MRGELRIISLPISSNSSGPNIDRLDHVLNIDESDNRPSLATVIETSEWYVGSKDKGRTILAEVLRETRRWRQAARALKIAHADVELTAAAFAESDAAHA
jgi:serine/threonine-protein kinase HipA